MEIVTIFDGNPALSTKAEEISFKKEDPSRFAHMLMETLRPRMPAAGLAAPQVGISKRIFIFSWNRTEEALEVVVNPIILWESAETSVSWEACFSAMQDQGECQAARVARPNTIHVEYFTLEGNLVRKSLTGFAARVFLHEYDHLEGLENVRKEGAEVKAFPNKAAILEFLRGVRTQDSVNYMEPIALD